MSNNKIKNFVCPPVTGSGSINAFNKLRNFFYGVLRK
jgi:hypothetical protein